MRRIIAGTVASEAPSLNIRPITHADIPALFTVRVATHENAMTLEELARLGITPETVAERLGQTHAGWLCEAEGRVVGFAMGDRATGEMWVIALLPEYVGRGIGSRLLREVETWLGATGWDRIWLTTDPDTSLRAYTFYRQHGWVDDRLDGGDRYMIKRLRA